jgi:hypothetical protein
MKRTALALLLAGIATQTTAQTLSFEGASLSFSSSDNRSQDYWLEQYEASVELGFGGAVSVQADVAKWDYEFSGGDNLNAWGLHLIYDVNPAFSVGAFYTDEWWENEGFTNTGVEAKYTGALGQLPVEVEGYAARYDEKAGGNYTLDLLALDASLGLGNGFSLTGGVARSDGGENMTVYRLGAEFALDAGARIAIEAISGDREVAIQDFDAVSLTLGFDLGGGTTFKPRKWVDLFDSF